jgi:DNA mismatch endonuclease Vsr
VREASWRGAWGTCQVPAGSLSPVPTFGRTGRRIRTDGLSISARALMTDIDPKRSAHMRLIRKADTKPELIVRRVAHRLGFRFRLHRRDLPGTPDLVFPRHRKISWCMGASGTSTPDVGSRAHQNRGWSTGSLSCAAIRSATRTPSGRCAPKAGLC